MLNVLNIFIVKVIKKASIQLKINGNNTHNFSTNQ